MRNTRIQGETRKYMSFPAWSTSVFNKPFIFPTSYFVFCDICVQIPELTCQLKSFQSHNTSCPWMHHQQTSKCCIQWLEAALPFNDNVPLTNMNTSPRPLSKAARKSDNSNWKQYLTSALSRNLRIPNKKSVQKSLTFTKYIYIWAQFKSQAAVFNTVTLSGNNINENIKKQVRNQSKHSWNWSRATLTFIN